MGSLQEVDLLLQKWDVAWAALASAESEYERSKRQIRPRHRLGRRLCPGAQPPAALRHKILPPQQYPCCDQTLLMLLAQSFEAVVPAHTPA